MMELFFGFLRVGCFTFGGAYSAIPLIREVVLSYGWLTDETLSHMIAVSESTPGPIMVNLATYVGSSQAGLPGAMLATLAVVLPSFLVILLIASLMRQAIKNKYVQAILRGLKPCMVGIILATGVYMTGKACLTAGGMLAVNVNALLIAALLFLARSLFQKKMKKKLSPIQLITLSAVLGVLIY
ncbi:MAG: chromate transporter [Clostridia bacterium]|nr:chromate transporter [Clostridia bacterium]